MALITFRKICASYKIVCETKCMASLSIWRTTNNCWFAQHMASEGDSIGLVSELLNSLTKGIMTFPQSNDCYRGALGLNLIFLENRCDLLIPEANHTQMDDICEALMVKIKQTYFDPYFDNKINCDLEFPIDFIPVITDKKIAQHLKDNSGAKHSFLKVITITNVNSCK